MRPLFVLLSAAGHSPPPLVDIDGTVFVQWLIFVILLVFLTRFVFRPYLALRAERARNIEGAREEAVKLEEDAATRGERYEEQLSKTRKEAAQERASLRQQGEAAAAKVLAEAHSGAAAKIEAARQRIEKSTQAAQLALRTRADVLAKAAAAKLLGREV